MATINSINWNQSLKTTDSPTFAGWTIGSSTALLKRTAWVLWDASAGTDYQAPLWFTPADAANVSNNIATDAASTTKFPSVKAIKDYADGLVVWLTDLRWAYDASWNVYPTTGWSWTAGAILKWDYWIISVWGTLGGNAIQAWDWIVALQDTPSSTDANWWKINTNITYVPEDAAKKDASWGYVGLTLLKINFKNVLNTFTSFLTNSNTAARTYTFPDKDWTVAMTSDISVWVTYSEVTGTSQAMAINTWYIMNNAWLVTGTLPATAALWSIIEVSWKGAGGWKVAQNASQTIHFGTSNSTTGIGGYLASTNTYDIVKLLCTTANTDFVVISSIGNLTIV